MPQQHQRFLRIIPLVLFCLTCKPPWSWAGDEVATLTLDRAIALALQHNPRLQAAQAETAMAQARVDRSRADFLPTLHLQEAYTRTNNPTAVFGAKLNQGNFSERDFDFTKLTNPHALGNFHSALSFTQPLYAGGRTQAAFARAQLQRQAHTLQQDRYTQEVAFAVTTSYFRVLYTQKQLTVLRAALNTAHTTATFAQQRLDSGLTVKADVLSADVRLASLKEKEIATHHHHALAYATLNNAMGLPLETIWDIDDQLPRITSPIPTVDELEQLALDHRPDYRQLAFEEQAHQQAIAQAQAAFLPTLQAVASYNFNRPDFFAPGHGNWSVGVVAQWNLFNGGADRAAVAEARAALRHTQALRTQAANSIKLEVRDAIFKLHSANERITVAERAMTQAEAALQIATDRYQVGLTTLVDVLANEEALTQARNALSESLYDYHIGWANAGLASGTLAHSATDAR